MNIESTRSENPTSLKLLTNINYRVFAVLAGLTGGILAFGAGELSYNAIPPELVSQNIQGNKVMLPTYATLVVSAARNSALAYGEFGAILGLSFGIAGGLARSSSRAAIRAGALGLILGAVLAVGVSLAGTPLFFTLIGQHEDQQLVFAMFLHGLIWGSVGSAAALAFGVGSAGGKGSLRFVAGGLIGAVVATVAADLSGAMFYPMGGADQPLSEIWQTRMLACLLVAVLVGLGVAWAIPSSQQARGPVPTGPTV